MVGLKFKSSYDFEVEYEDEKGNVYVARTGCNKSLYNPDSLPEIVKKIGTVTYKYAPQFYVFPSNEVVQKISELIGFQLVAAKFKLQPLLKEPIKHKVVDDGKTALLTGK